MSTTENAPRGMVPSQWFTRMLGVGLLVLGLVAVVGARNDIARYLRIRRM